MKIAIAAAGSTTDAMADPRFGRCAYFVVVDIETGDVAAVENPGAQAGSGAGIQAAQTVAKSGADAVVAANYGPNAHEALSAGGIEAYVGAEGTVAAMVEAFKAGQMQKVSEATVPSHFGTGNATAPDVQLGSGPRQGTGRGMGMGRGMGRGGGGQGPGRGGGRGR